MTLNSEQETICKVFRELRSGGVNCHKCPMVLSVRDCVCLRNVTEEEARENWDWDGSPYPALEQNCITIRASLPDGRAYIDKHGMVCFDPVNNDEQRDNKDGRKGQ